jgi:hypothetical protein
MSFSDKDQTKSAHLSQRLLQALYVPSLKSEYGGTFELTITYRRLEACQL